MTNLIPGAWRVNIVSKGFLPEGCHGVVAKADSNDFYIEEHLAEDFLDRLHETYIQHEPADEEFDVTGLKFKMGDDSIEQVTGVEAFDDLIHRLHERWDTIDEIIDEQMLSEDQGRDFAAKFNKAIDWMREAAEHEDFNNDHADWYAESFEHLAETNNKLWADRNLVDQNVIDDIERVELLEASRHLIGDHIGKMLTHGYYSPDVAQAYKDAREKFKARRQEILDQKAAEEPTDIPAFGLTMDQVEYDWVKGDRQGVPQSLEQAVQEIIEGLEEPIVTGTFAIDGLHKDAVEIEQSSEGLSTIYWRDGSWTTYDEAGRKIDHYPDDFSTGEVFATTFKDYVKKMFQPTKWKLGE